MGLANSVVTVTGLPLNISFRKEDQFPFWEQSPRMPYPSRLCVWIVLCGILWMARFRYAVNAVNIFSTKWIKSS